MKNYLIFFTPLETILLSYYKFLNNYLTHCIFIILIVILIIHFIKKKKFILAYIEEIKNVNKNIIFPEKKQIQKTFLLIIFICCFLGFLIWLMDVTVILIVKKILLN